MTNAAALLQTSLAGLQLVRRGKVRHVYYREGEVVKGGATIVEME